MKPALPYFEETQWLRDTRWIWYVCLATGLSTLIPLMYVAYWQLIRGEPVGDKPMSDLGIVIFLCAFVVMMLIFVVVIRVIRLSVLVDRDGVHYNFIPSTLGWKHIPKDSIVNYEVQTRRTLFEYVNGYSINLITKTRKMRLAGSQIVRFQLKDRWKIMIGTRRPDEFLNALKRMSSSAPNIF